jgi:Fe-S oxidoreductase
MAGAYGMLEHHRALSRQVARPLVEAIGALPPATSIVASGTSCRHQITDLTAARPLHIAEILARVLSTAP